MNGFYNLKIAHKLALGFGLCLLLSAALGAFSLSRMAGMNAVTQSIVNETIPRDIDCGQMLYHGAQFRMLEYRHLVTMDTKSMNIVEGMQQQEQQDMDSTLADYGKTVNSDQDKQNWQNVKTSWAQYVQSHQQFLPISRADRTKEGTALMNGPMLEKFNTLHDQLDTMVDYNKKYGQELSRKSADSYAAARILVFALLCTSIMVGVLINVVITRYMTQALTQISDRLNCIDTICVENLGVAIAALEEGDLTVKIVTGTEPMTSRSKDEFGQVAQAFNSMLVKLQSAIAIFRSAQIGLGDLIENIKQSAAQVDSAAHTLSGSSQQIGATTEEISATMHEVAQASEQSARGASEIAQGSATQAASVTIGSEQVKELVSAIQSVVRDTEAATQSTVQANETVATGSKAVEKTVAGMGRIQSAVRESADVIASLGQTSAKIGGIVQTINEIAGQTNLLALNAAIEAARAGEAGRGFAVVADEVRKLAERCTMATKDIGGLIGEIQSQTQQAVTAMELGTREVIAGTSLAGEAGASLARIQAVVLEMSGQVMSISAAAEEMSASAEEVSGTITEVAAVVEESAAAAEEMSASAEQVSASVQTVAGTTSQQGTAVEELVASASELAGVSQSLSSLISRFKTQDTLAAVSAKSSVSTKSSVSAKPTLTLRKVA